MTLRAPLLTVGAGTARKAGRPHGRRNGWPASWGARSRYTFEPETTYELRVTFAEAAYQVDPAVTVPCNVGNAVAAGGGQAALAVTILNGVGNAVGAGSVFALNQSLAFTVGNAVGAGSAFAINQAIAGGIGNAVAAGSTASVSLYAARITWAEAQYQASPNVTIPFSVGNAVAAGATAGVTVYGAVRITWAEAQYQASDGTTITPTVGNAVAGGPAGATVSEDITIVPTVGNAVAGGPSGASVSVDASIDCGIGDATAAGQQCQVLPPLTVAPSATPGYAPKTRYRVRVGRRWLEVDPLDPMSVRRAYDVAQEDAQDAATQDIEAPAAVAAQAVVVQPIKGPDYAGLAKEARRISEDIRKVYADALQTALIARLMREQMERDDEDDIAVLLASI